MICIQPNERTNEKIYQLHNDGLACDGRSFRPPRSDKDAMEGKEKAAWQAFKDKKPDDFKKVVIREFRGCLR